MMILYILLGVFVVFILVPLIAGNFFPKEHEVTRELWLPQGNIVVWDLVSHHEMDLLWRSDLRKIEHLDDEQGKPVWKETSRHGNELILRDDERTEGSMLLRTIIRNRNFGGYWLIEVKPGTNNSTSLRVTEKGSIHNPMFRFMFSVFFKKTSTIDQYLDMLKRYLDKLPEAH